MLRAIHAEFRKLKRSRIPLWTVAIVVLFPAIAVGSANLFAAPKATTSLTFVRINSQFLANGLGVILFGFVASYVFGREYAEGTIEHALTLPIRREYLAIAKLVVTAVWVMALTLLAVAVGAATAALFGLNDLSWAYVRTGLQETLTVSLLILGTLPLIGLLAMVGRGYLMPMVASAITATAGLGLAESGWTRWFPWAMPTAVVGMVLGPPLPMPGLVPGSWVLMAALFVVGVVAIIWYVDWADNPS